MRTFWIAITIFAAGCGASPRPPSSSGTGGTAGGDTITGGENLGWTQRADDRSQLATYQYALYVDGGRTVLPNPSCSTSAGSAGFECTAALPTLTPGTHTLQLAAFVVSNDGIVESERSPPLQVTVATTAALGAGGAPAQRAPAQRAETSPAASRFAFRFETLAKGFVMPVDAAVTESGAVFIGEREGRVTLLTEMAATSDRIPAGAAPEDHVQLLSFTLAPDYLRSHFLFAVHAAPREDGALIEVARYREVEGQLGERAVVFAAAASSVPSNISAVVRFGPDGKLYVLAGVSDGSGWLIRLNADGTTPRDSAGISPQLATGFDQAHGLAWAPESGLLWVADETSNGAQLGPIAAAPASIQTTTLPWQELGTRARSLTFYTSQAIDTLDGNALLGSDNGQILRVLFDRDDPTRVRSAETLFDPNAGPVRVVTVSAAGAIYFLTDSLLGRLTVNGSARTPRR